MSSFYLFGGVLLLLLGTIIWAAIRSGADTGAVLAPRERMDAAIEALRDLELEYRTGKVTDEEYASLRARLEAEALRGRDASGVSGACPDCGFEWTGDEAFCPGCGAKRAG